MPKKTAKGKPVLKTITSNRFVPVGFCKPVKDEVDKRLADLKFCGPNLDIGCQPNLPLLWDKDDPRYWGMGCFPTGCDPCTPDCVPGVVCQPDKKTSVDVDKGRPPEQIGQAKINKQLKAKIAALEAEIESLKKSIKR